MRGRLVEPLVIDHSPEPQAITIRQLLYLEIAQYSSSTQPLRLWELGIQCTEHYSDCSTSSSVVHTESAPAKTAYTSIMLAPIHYKPRLPSRRWISAMDPYHRPCAVYFWEILYERVWHVRLPKSNKLSIVRSLPSWTG